MNRIGAKNSIEKIKNTMEPPRIIDTIVTPALMKLGEEWEKGTVSLAQVYMVGKISEEIVDELLPPKSPDRTSQPPMAIITREQYLKTGFNIAKKMIARIKGPTATHLASGRELPILNDIAKTGTAGVGVSALEDLAEIKKICRNKLAVIGNLNGIEMRRWTVSEVEAKVKEAIAKAAPGGGFVLSDNHGEIPWQVKEETLFAISDAAQKWGRYPIDIEF